MHFLCSFLFELNQAFVCRSHCSISLPATTANFTSTIAIMKIAAKAGAKAGASVGIAAAHKNGAAAGAEAGAQAGAKAGAEAGAKAAAQAATEVATKTLSEALLKLGRLKNPVSVLVKGWYCAI